MDHPRDEGATRPSLLLQLRDHSDVEAWTTFTLLYAPLVYGYCRKRGLQDADAADITQEVLRQVSRSIRSFDYDPRKGRFRDWLRMVTRRKVSRFLAGQAGAELSIEWVSPDEIAEGPADAEWADDFNARVLQVALEQIRPRFEGITWRAFERTWVAGADARQVALEVGMPIDHVYTARSRVLKHLRAQILLLAGNLPHLM